MTMRMSSVARALGGLRSCCHSMRAGATVAEPAVPFLRRRLTIAEATASRSQQHMATLHQHRSASTTSKSGMPAPLPFEEAKFNSAVVDVSKIKVEDTADFALKLFATVDVLRKSQKAALWLKVPADFCHYISVAAHTGFEFHHTQPKYVMMCLWLPHDVPNKIPPYGTHHLGVAGCVMNDEREVLLVKDKHKSAMWKFPGGLADPGEGIGEAAIREVWEETGVEAEFRSVLSMRHQHDMQFGNSDLYFICRLVPKAGGVVDITKCQHEIADACWMPLDQFKRETRHSMLAVVAEMLHNPEEKELIRSLHESVIPGRAPYFLYHRHT